MSSVGGQRNFTYAKWHFFATFALCLVSISLAQQRTDSFDFANQQFDYTDDDDGGQLYTYDEIVREMNEMSMDYLRDVASLHHMTTDMMARQEDEINLSRRRKRSTSDVTLSVPFFIREGTKPISRVLETGWLCRGPHDVIDVKVLPFEGEDFAICLIVSRGNYALLYGPAYDVRYRLDANLGEPIKLLAFVNRGSASWNEFERTLIVLVLNHKTAAEQHAVSWFQFDSKHQLIHANHIKQLIQVSPHNSAVWKHEMVIFHDVVANNLQVFTFAGTYFDFEAQISVSNDLSSLCPFSIYGKQFVALGYRNLRPDSRQYVQPVEPPKAIAIMQFEENNFKIFDTISIDHDVIDLSFFTFGRDDAGRKQEKFLTIVTAYHLVFYKFLDFRPMIFQRIEIGGVRRIAAYGDSESLFVMLAVHETNDVTLIIYNSFRFMISSLQKRIYLFPRTPLFFFKPLISSSSSSSSATSIAGDHHHAGAIQLWIGARGGVQTYEIAFWHDKSLLHEWQRAMAWCRRTHSHIAAIKQRNVIVRKNFTEAYFRSDPLHVKGTLYLTNFTSTLPIEADEYRQEPVKGERAFTLNSEYFDSLQAMENRLHEIDRSINAGNARLADAIFVQPRNELQHAYGNYTFTNVVISKYAPEQFNSTSSYPVVGMNLATDRLNGHEAFSLFEDTIRLRSGARTKLAFIKPLQFEQLEIANSLTIDALTNDRFNLSDIVTTNGDDITLITGRKRLHHCLLVDEQLSANLVNGKNFTSQTVLLMSEPQRILNPVRMTAANRPIRTGELNAVTVNGIDMKRFFSDIVRKQDSVQILSPIVFANTLEINDLYVNGSYGRLNGHVIDELYDDVLWLDRPNQTLYGEYNFRSNLHVDGHLFVDRVNQKNIPADLLLGYERNSIKGAKRFESLVVTDDLVVADSLNDLQIINGMPDILMRNHAQNITGFKSLVSTLHISNHSVVGGSINDLDLVELQKQSLERSGMKYYEKLHIENANFIGGISFDRLNGVTRTQFDQLMRHSVGVNQPWDQFDIGEINFENLFVNTLDCRLVNNLNLDSDLLSRNTNQYVIGSYRFNRVMIEDASTIGTLNNRSMSLLENVFRTYGDQKFDLKIFGDNISVKSLRAKSINLIPVEEIVFGDDLITKPITGRKLFRNSTLRFDYLTALHVKVDSINHIDVRRLLHKTLQRNTPQTISQDIRFKVLHLNHLNDFRVPSINGINLRDLERDLISPIGGDQLQNITGAKHFTGAVSFEDIHFDRRFDGATYWEMAHNWMVWNEPQRVDATFHVDLLETRHNVTVHDRHLSSINLDVLDSSVVRLDRKTVIHSNVAFMGQVNVEGNIILNGLLNGIDLRQDVVYSHFDGIQTIRGVINFANHVSVMSNLDIIGRINGIDVRRMCANAYRRPPINASSHQRPIIVNGNVRIMAPIFVDVINNITYDELRTQTIRHDRPYQNITGQLIAKTIVFHNDVEIRHHLNNIRLEDINRTYMSRTRDQVIEAEIVLQNDAQFIGDIVADRFYVQSGIIDGVDLATIDRTALKTYGDQSYSGNIVFNANVSIGLDFAARSLNGVSVEHLMRKDRQVHSFLEETIFTRDLIVTDNVNIVNGRRLAGVNIEAMRRNAVMRNRGDRNYTIRGEKTFDSIHVSVIHTERISSIPITKRHLLLRSDPQTITGRISFAGNVHVNRSLIRTVNDIPLNDFHQQIVRKNAPNNVITTPVQFDGTLSVANADVRALIDNVNISVFNRIAETVGTLDTLQTFSTISRRDFDQFERHLSTIAAKFLFYEHHRTIDLRSRHLRLRSSGIDASRSPLLIESMHNYWTIFVASPSDHNCYSIRVLIGSESLTATSSAKDAKNLKHVTLYSPAPIIAVHQTANVVIVVSAGSSSREVTENSVTEQCIVRNIIPTELERTQISQLMSLPIEGKSIYFQIFHFLPDRQAATMFHLGRFAFGNRSRVRSPKIAFLTSTHAVICASLPRSSTCALLCLNCNRSSSDIVPLSSIQFENIVSIRQVVTSTVSSIIAVLSANRVTVLRRIADGDRLIVQQTIPIPGADSILLVNTDTHGDDNGRLFLWIAEAKQSFTTQSPVHVYAIDSLSQNPRKIQEIDEGIVHEMQVFYSKPPASPHPNYGGENREPFVLLRTEASIIIYRFASNDFRRHSRIGTDDRLRSMRIIKSNNHLALYFDSHCRDNDNDYHYYDHSEDYEQSGEMNEDEFHRKSYIEILRPRFRQAITWGEEIAKHEIEWSDQQRSSNESSRTSSEIIVH